MPRRSHNSLRRERDGGRRPSAARGGRDDVAVPLGGRETQRTAQGDYVVRMVPGESAGKPYRCPGCQQVIPAGTAHLVV